MYFILFYASFYNFLFKLIHPQLLYLISESFYMKKSIERKKKKCAICGRYFCPDRRVGDRQKCCKSRICQKKLKLRRDRIWRAENPDYFKGRYDNTKEWRLKHPEYQKKKQHEIQAEFIQEKHVESAFVALGVKIINQKAKIQVEIPHGISVKRIIPAYGVPR